MKKLMLVAVVCFVAITAAFYSSCKNKESQPVSKEDSLKEVVARGEYIAHHVAVCMDCHSKREFDKFSLPPAPGTYGIGASFPFGKGDGIPGEIWAPNITPSRLKDWTDDEIARAIAHGVNKAGDTLFPIMPYHNYSKMAKEDLYAVVAFLRTLPASDSTVPPRQLEIPMSVLGPLPEFAPEKNIKPDPSDKVNYGGYLVTMASCAFCHTPMKEGGMEFDFEKSFAGGQLFANPMFKVVTANITPDSTTGIGTWTEEAFIAKFRNNSSDEMMSKDPGKMNSVMPWAMYGKMKDDDLKAIYAYLRTVKPVSNKIEKYPQ